MARQPLLSTEMAASIGLRALAFIAADEERLMRFIALTGMSPGDLQEQVHNSSFPGAVLDYLSQDESQLLAFAANEQLPPESVMRACALLNPQWEGDV
jgi:hypothetical protein